MVFRRTSSTTAYRTGFLKVYIAILEYQYCHHEPSVYIDRNNFPYCGIRSIYTFPLCVQETAKHCKHAHDGCVMKLSL